ncbi:MAG: hypothetical protein P8N31_12895 [Planctomycetota bacterium]|nr:hypothetical protein [Planctomycetota bacterium]MDG2144443.1 hypothetical protein [Planctomycetota bacterium]
MHKNQKLAITAVVALCAGFGVFKTLQDDDVNANNSISPPAQEAPKEDKVVNHLMNLSEKEAPKELQRVKNGLNKRFGHLGEDMLASASVDAGGSKVYFFSKLTPGRAADGSTIWSQAIGRTSVFKGERMQPAINDSITARTQRPQGRKNKDFFLEAMRNTNLEQPSLPSPVKPPGQK